jgi:methylated-DNA-[protein]-cysteine S-methyltransferase
LSKEEESISLVSLHLRCCGGPTGESEEKRIAEATEIRNNIDTFQSPRWIIAGDWNLVGTKEPLKIVLSDDLAIVEAYQPDGLLNATWSDRTSSFTPGRLDWMLYSPKTFEVVNSFVLDTADLDRDSLAANDLLSEDIAHGNLFCQFGRLRAEQKAPEKLVRQLVEYFAGKKICPFTAKLPAGPHFTHKCWEVCRSIPYGTTISYKELATLAGSPKAVRAAGQAMKRNPLVIITPCHRVLSSSGHLHGYAGETSIKSKELKRKQFLLDLEQSTIRL